MKKQLLTIALSLALPILSFAAFNDATLTTDTAFSVGGYTLNVSGASAIVESVTVGASALSAVLQPGSIISVSSASGKVLTTNASSVNISGNECTAAGKSILTLMVPSDATASVTVSITPTSSTCTSSASNSGSSTNGAPAAGGGGGGGGGSVYIAPVNPAVSAKPATPAVPGVSPAVPAIPAIPAVVFKKILSVGVTSSDVMSLQQILNADPDTMIASMGAGSPGKETKYFGPATKKAIQKFQVKFGISGPGKDGYGILGPKTRTKLNEISSKTSMKSSVQTSASTPATNSTTDIAQKLSDSLKLLQSLQDKLKALK